MARMGLPIGLLLYWLQANIDSNTITVSLCRPLQFQPSYDIFMQFYDNLHEEPPVPICAGELRQWAVGKAQPLVTEEAIGLMQVDEKQQCRRAILDRPLDGDPQDRDDSRDDMDLRQSMKAMVSSHAGDDDEKQDGNSHWIPDDSPDADTEHAAPPFNERTLGELDRPQ